METKVFFWIFLILGISALIAAIFFNAPHHFFTAAFYGIVVIFYAIDLKKMKRQNHSNE